MGIYTNNKIYGVRVVSFDGILLHEIVSDKELNIDQINNARTYLSKGVSIYIYVSVTSTYNFPVKTEFVWKGVSSL